MNKSAQRKVPAYIAAKKSAASSPREVYRDIERLVDGLGNGSTARELTERIRNPFGAQELIDWRRDGGKDTVLMALAQNGYVEQAKALVAVAARLAKEANDAGARFRNPLVALINQENSSGQTALDLSDTQLMRRELSALGVPRGSYKRDLSFIDVGSAASVAVVSPKLREELLRREATEGWVL
jgi:hypothetical protein